MELSKTIELEIENKELWNYAEFKYSSKSYYFTEEPIIPKEFEFLKSLNIISLIDGKYKIPLKIQEEYIDYLKKEIENNAKISKIALLPPSLAYGEEKWKLYITLIKNIDLLTTIKNFQKISIIGIYLNKGGDVAYSLWIWNNKEALINQEKNEYIKLNFNEYRFHKREIRSFISLYPKIIRELLITFYSAEKISDEIINIALKSIEEYKCNIAIISFIDRISRGPTNLILQSIIRGVHGKALWNYPNKIITYFPKKKEKKIKQILIDPRNNIGLCSNCNNKMEYKGKIAYCKKCNKEIDIYLNYSSNIAKRTIEILREIYNMKPPKEAKPLGK